MTIPAPSTDPVVPGPMPLPAPAPGTPVTPPAAVTPPAPSWLDRLKASEPVRLYLYSALLVVLGGLVLAGVLTTQWEAFGISAGATLLVVPAATEAARSSVYSTAGALRAIARAQRPAPVVPGSGVIPPAAGR